MSELRMAAAMDHIVEASDDVDAERGGRHRPRPRHGDGPGRGRKAVTPDQVHRLRLVERTLDARGARPGRGALAEARHTGWGQPLPPSARVPGRVLGPRRRRDRGRAPPSAGAALRDVPRPAGGGTQRGAGDSGQGADRVGLRRPCVLGHGGIRPADAQLLLPRGGSRCAALASLDARPGQAAGRASSGSRAPPFPGGRSTAPSAPAIGRPARPPFTSTPTSPTPSRATCIPARTIRVREGRAGSSCWSRPPGCGARSDTTTPPARSGSTGSPAPTSMAPSPTTTSTPTWRRGRT